MTNVPDSLSELRQLSTIRETQGTAQMRQQQWLPFELLPGVGEILEAMTQVSLLEPRSPDPTDRHASYSEEVDRLS